MLHPGQLTICHGHAAYCFLIKVLYLIIFISGMFDD